MEGVFWSFDGADWPLEREPVPQRDVPVVVEGGDPAPENRDSAPIPSTTRRARARR
jgi:hypothetical protein